MGESPPKQDDPNHANRNAGNNAPQLGAQPSSPQDNPAYTKNKKSSNKYWRTNDLPMLIVTFLGVVAVVAYTCVAHQQLSVMQGQLDTMKADQRPWIGGPSDIKPRISDDGKTVTFIQIFKNVGRNPTAGFYIDGKLIAEDDFWYSNIQTMCKTAMDVVAKSNQIAGTGFAAVPGSDWILDVAEMPSSNGMIFKIDDLRKMKKPIIIGCVLYGSPLDKIIHKTGYYSRIDIKGNAVSIAFIYTVDAD